MTKLWRKTTPKYKGKRLANGAGKEHSQRKWQSGRNWLDEEKKRVRSLNAHPHSSKLPFFSLLTPKLNVGPVPLIGRDSILFLGGPVTSVALGTVEGTNHKRP